MIHSLSGGVLADNSPMLFAKVDVLGTPCWYLAPFFVEAGDKVLVPFGREERLTEGTVLRTETCTRQTAPVPVSRAKSIREKLETH